MKYKIKIFDGLLTHVYFEEDAFDTGNKITRLLDALEELKIDDYKMEVELDVGDEK